MYVPPFLLHHSTHSVLQESSHTLSPTEIRIAARRTALQQIDIQREEFRQLGVMADWDGDSSLDSGRGIYRTLGTHIDI